MSQATSQAVNTTSHDVNLVLASQARRTSLHCTFSTCRECRGRLWIRMWVAVANALVVRGECEISQDARTVFDADLCWSIHAQSPGNQATITTTNLRLSHSVTQILPHTAELASSSGTASGTVGLQAVLLLHSASCLARRARFTHIFRHRLRIHACEYRNPWS
jgi:hypothetical protein